MFSIYQLVVESVSKSDVDSNKVEIGGRRRRSLPSVVYDYLKAKKHNLSYYITAEIDASKVPGRFLVGDNEMYGDYRNVPLKPETNYKLHVRAGSKTKDDVSCFSYSNYIIYIVDL